MQRMEHKAAMPELQAKEAKVYAERARADATRDQKQYTKAHIREQIERCADADRLSDWSVRAARAQ